MLANIEMLRNERNSNYVVLNRDSGATTVVRYSTATAMVKIFPGILKTFPSNTERAAYIKDCKGKVCTTKN